jgi:hypothetical protein
MSGMSLPLLRRPLGRSGLVLSLTLIGGFAGLTYGVQAPPEYTARAYVAAAGATPDPTAYVRLATSAPVRARATAELDGDPTGLDRVTSAARTGALVELTARSRSATRAARLANAVATALAAEVGPTAVAPAGVPARPSSPDAPGALLIGISGGLLTGALAALLTLRRRRAARPTFADPAEIEGHLRIWPAQHRSGQLGPGQLGPGQLGPGQLGPGQLGPGQLGPGQLGSGRLRPDPLGRSRLGADQRRAEVTGSGSATAAGKQTCRTSRPNTAPTVFDSRSFTSQ